MPTHHARRAGEGDDTDRQHQSQHRNARLLPALYPAPSPAPAPLDDLTGQISLSGRKLLADVTGRVGTASVDLTAGQVSQLQMSLTVPVEVAESGDGSLLDVGRVLTWGDQVWQVSAVDRAYSGDQISLEVTARSRLARRLRSVMGPKAWRHTAPKAWIAKTIGDYGGRAVVQGGAQARHIVQKADQSLLAVMEQLSSDMATRWVERGDVMFVGTGWWALTGHTGLPMWSLDVHGAQVLKCSTRASIDDRDAEATAEVTVPVPVARKFGVWDRVWLEGVIKPDAGIWLIDGLSYDLREDAEATLKLVRPHRTDLVARPVRQHTESAGKGQDDGAFGAEFAGLDGDPGEWIPKADEVHRNCTRTPRQYVRWAQSRVGSSWGYHRCLAFVSTVVSGGEGRGGQYARYVWERKPGGTLTWPGDYSPPIGAILVWNGNFGGGAGHIAVSVGGGKMITTTDGSPGIDVWPITRYRSPAYYGGMAPNFYI